MASDKSFSLYGSKLWRLTVLAFVTGTVIMSLELVASRILIPVFGGSIFTWGSLIGVVLTGLSIGYFVGGRLADNKPTFKKFCSLIFSAGLYIVFIPFIAPSVLEAFSLPLYGNQYAPLLASFSLLLVPNILLGSISPYAVKLGTSTLRKIGNVSGNLYFISAIGSILGTFATTFVLIGQFEIRQIVFALGIILMVSSLLGLTKSPKIATAIVIVLIFFPASTVVVGALAHSGTLLYEKETPYSHMDIINSGKYRSLILDGMTHSRMYLDNPIDLVIKYTKYFHLGMLYNPDSKDVLFVGGGGFSGPKNFLATYDNISVDVIEIDPDVIDAARNYFGVTDDPRLRILNEDARNFLSKSNKKYDVIVLDAYSKDYVPFHLLTNEYFQLLKDRLNPEGIIIFNMVTSIAGDTSDLFRAIYKTMKESYPTIYVFPTNDNPLAIKNTITVAINADLQYSKEEFIEILVTNDKNLLLSGLFMEPRDFKINTDDVPFLTDQYAPVEILLNPITSKPYVLEEQSINSKSTIPWAENTYITITMLFIVVIYWMIYMVATWKNPFQNEISN